MYTRVSCGTILAKQCVSKSLHCWCVMHAETRHVVCTYHQHSILRHGHVAILAPQHALLSSIPVPQHYYPFAHNGLISVLIDARFSACKGYERRCRRSDLCLFMIT